MRNWRVDLGLFALAALLGLAFFADSLATGGEAPPIWLDVTIGGGAALAVLVWYRSRPVWLAVVLIPALIVSSTAMGSTAVALFAVARARSWPVTAVVVSAHAALVTVLFSAFAGDPRTFWQALIAVLALDAAFVATGRLVRSHGLLVASLEERAQAAEEGQRLRLAQARRSERERIAREMHDVLAHRISLVAVHAGALEVRRGAPVDERRAAGVVRESAYLALEELREVIGVLRTEDDPDDAPQPTLADLPALVEQSRAAGAEVALDDRRAAPGVGGRHLYRIVQEGLTNARKHAPGSPIQILLADAGSGLSVEIVNSAPGPAPAALPGAGAGLAGLRERMDLAGGRLEHGPTPAGGFRLYAWVPS